MCSYWSQFSVRLARFSRKSYLMCASETRAAGVLARITSAETGLSRHWKRRMKMPSVLPRWNILRRVPFVAIIGNARTHVHSHARSGDENTRFNITRSSVEPLHSLRGTCPTQSLFSRLTPAHGKHGKSRSSRRGIDGQASKKEEGRSIVHASNSTFE